MKEVKAWETIDGQLFKYDEHDRAERWEKNFGIKRSIINSYEENKAKIEAHIKTVMGLSEIEELEYDPNFDAGGWDCDDEDNPIGKCIYYYDYDFECCVYCNSPEERK